MNNNRTLPLVSVSQAELLKRAGYDWPCTEYWVRSWPGSNSIHGIGWIEMKGMNSDHNTGDYSLSRPTVHEATRWLGEVKDLWAYPGKVCKNGSNKFSFNYYDEKTLTCADEIYDTWDAAESAGLDLILSTC